MKKQLLFIALFCASPIVLFAQSVPTIVADIYTGSVGSGVEALTVFQGSLFFRADGSVTTTSQLWKFDGTSASLPGLLPSTGGVPLEIGDFPYPLGVANNRIYFPVDSIATLISAGLWYSTGTGIPAVVPGTAVGLFYSEMVTIGTNLYFGADGGTVRGIYLVDAANTTHLALDVSTLIISNSVNNIHEMAVLNNKIYFVGSDGNGYYELCVFDPVANTSSVINTTGTIGSFPNGGDPQNLVVGDDNKLYFSATSSTDGRELYVYDGVTATKLTSLNGPSDGVTEASIGSRLDNIAKLGNNIYFNGCDGVHGYELMKYDLTANTSSLVKDMKPGSAYSTISGLTVYDGKLYFSYDDGTHGYELWSSDGTTANTQMVDDTNPGSANSSPSSMTVYDGKLYFSANDGTSGKELFRLSSTTGIEIANGSVNEIIVYPNPVHEQANISLNLKADTKIIVKLYDITGRELSCSPVTEHTAGTSLTTLLMCQYVPGEYQYSIYNDHGTLLGSGKIAHF